MEITQSLADRRTLIGGNIRQARKRRGLSQRELAMYVEVTWHHLSDWERGVSEPSPRSMGRVAEALGHPFGWFYVEHSPNEEAAA
jgi:transcriptional regulator with XRE-family HTH domain